MMRGLRLLLAAAVVVVVALLPAANAVVLLVLMVMSPLQFPGHAVEVKQMVQVLLLAALCVHRVQFMVKVTATWVAGAGVG